MKKIEAVLLAICMAVQIVVSSVHVEARTPIIEKAISWAIAIADDDSHGYSMNNRWGPDYDCASFVITAFKNAGVNTGSAINTGNMRSQLTQHGFEWIPWSKIGNMSNLKRGDILLNEVEHTEIYLGNGKNVGAHSDRGYPQTGDQTGTEVSISGYYNHPWNGVLRYKDDESPQGVVDNIIGGVNNVKVYGWAYDWDNINASIKVHVYIGGPAGSAGAEGHEITAGADSSDLVGNGIPGNHRFAAIVPTEKVGDQEVYLYAINIGGGSNVEIGHGKVHIDANPIGTVDNVTGGKEYIKVYGWAYDWDNINKSIKIHVYIGGPAGSEGVECHEITADASSPDLIGNGVPGNHRFATKISTSKSGKQDVYLYAINVGGGSNIEIGHKTVEVLSPDIMAKENKGTMSDGDYHIVSTKTNIGLGFKGDNIQLGENTLDDTQIMHVTNLGDGYYKITSKQSGQVLDVENESSKEGTNLRLYKDTGTSAQKWIIKEADDNYNYYIISGCSAQAIDITNGLIQAGTNIRMWTWNKSAAQKWHFIRCNKGEQRPVEDGNYRIISALDLKMGLNVEAANSEDGTNINIYQNTEDYKQIFNIAYIGEGFYKIINTYTKTGLFVSNSNPYRGNNIVANKDSNIKSMHWGIKKSENGKYYKIYCQNGGNYLDVDSGIAENKRNVQLWSENYTAAQNWLLISDEELEAEVTAEGLNAIISWNSIPWADEYEVTIINDKKENYVKKIVKGTKYDVQLPVGQYSISVKAISNDFDYARKSKNVEISIIRTKEDQVVNDIVFEGATFTFDGSEKNIVVQQNLPEGVTVKYEGNGNVAIGSHIVIARFFDENGNLIDVKKAIMVIKPKEISNTVQVKEVPSQAYTGNRIVPEIKVLDGNVELKKDIDYTYQCVDNINVGTSTITIKFIGNYRGEKNTTFSIIKAENEWTTQLKCQNIKYGEEIKAFATAKFGNVEYKFSDTPLGDYKTEKPVDAGSYYVKAFIAETSNYNAIESEPVRFDIEKIEYDLSGVMFENREFTYDKKEKYVTVTGKIPDGIQIQYSNNGKTNAGEYYVTAKLIGDNNHKECNNLIAKLTIKPIYVQIPEGKIKEYQNGENIIGVEETSEIKVVSGENAAKPGKYQAIIRLKDPENYRWIDGTTGDQVVLWEIKELSQHRHKLQMVEGKPATCETKGYEQYWKCETCGKLFTDREGVSEIYNPIEISATGHQETEIRKKKEATCEEDGYTGNEYCTKCKKLLKKGETVFALDHEWNNVRNVKEATCIESGEKVYTCIRCKKTRLSIVPALDHKWDEGIITKQPSTTEEGIRTYHCQNDGCKETKTEKIAKLPNKEEPSTKPGTSENKPSTDGTKPSSGNKNPTTEAPKKNTGATQKTLKVGTKITDKKSKAVYKVTGKNTVQYIKASVKNVKTVNIPAFITVNKVKYQVNSIAVRALKGNKKLTKVVIPASIRSIGAQAFAGCKNLKNIVIQTSYLTKKNVGAGAFKGISAKAVIKVPKKQLKDYQKLLKAKGVSQKAKIRK